MMLSSSKYIDNKPLATQRAYARTHAHTHAHLRARLAQAAVTELQHLNQVLKLEVDSDRNERAAEKLAAEEARQQADAEKRSLLAPIAAIPNFMCQLPGSA